MAWGLGEGWDMVWHGEGRWELEGQILRGVPGEVCPWRLVQEPGFWKQKGLCLNPDFPS